MIMAMTMAMINTWVIYYTASFYQSSFFFFDCLDYYDDYGDDYGDDDY